MPLLALIFCAVLLCLTGCNRDSDAATIQHVRLGYFANLTHAQAVLGVASGDFQSALGPSIRVEPQVFNAGPSLIQALFAGEIDIGYVGPGPVLAANERTAGRGLRVIAGAAANGVVIVARADAGIRTLNDLPGKRLATPQHGNTQDIAARHFVRFDLSQPDLSTVMPIPNAEQAALMARRQIDAAWVPEPWGARLIAETGAELIAQEKDLWPDRQFALTCIVTTPEFLATHPDAIKAILAVHTRWTDRLMSSPAAHAPALSTALRSLTGKSLPPGVIDAALTRVEFTTDPLPGTFGTMGRWAHALGFLRRDPRLDRLIDTRILHTVAGAAAPPASR